LQVNGRQITALLDTGANLMAMSAGHARQLGINYLRGEKALVSTASGVAPAYRVKLKSVAVGGIVADHVAAVVIEGDYPEQVLLGMSYLEHVDMQEKDNILTLKARY
jgi:aspartyl protease family protein